LLARTREIVFLGVVSVLAAVSSAGATGGFSRAPGVPAFSSRHARLALRAGNDGAPGEEDVLLVSEEFAIEAAEFAPVEPTTFVRGEWRTLEVFEEEGNTPQLFPGLHPEPRPSIAPAGHPANASKRLPRPAAPEKPALRTGDFQTVDLTHRPARRPVLPRLPAASPRRE